MCVAGVLAGLCPLDRETWQSLQAVLEDDSHVGGWAFPGEYPLKSERLASRAVPRDSSLQAALQAL